MVAVKGWELLSICVTCFVPTLRLQKVVAAHMLKGYFYSDSSLFFFV